MAERIRECKPEEKDYEIVFSAAETRLEHDSIEQLIRKLEEGTLIDSIAEQRDGDQTSKKDKSLLIHTIFKNLSILPISINQVGTGAGAKREVRNGKQRLTSLVQYKNNEFALSNITPPIPIRRVVKVPKLDADGNSVMEKTKGKRKATVVMVPKLDGNGNVVTEVVPYKIAGKYYSELPDSFKRQFNNYSGMGQLIHINYTEDEAQQQMIRDNTFVKMTPAQLGMVVCGRELATWLRSFRFNDLFLNRSTWKEKTQINKGLIERCVIEAFILSVLDGEWHNQYEQNVELFKKNAVDGYMESFVDIINDLATVLKDFPELKQHLVNQNLHIIIAAYAHFCDMDKRYEKSDFSRFLVKWFNEIKDTTEYEVEGNTGTKKKTTVLGKLAIIDKECGNYMEQYGTIIGTNEDNLVSNNINTKTGINNFISDFGGEEKDALCALMEIDEYSKRDDFTDANVAEYKNWLSTNFSNELAIKCLDIQDEIMSVASEDSDLTNPYNLPIVIRMFSEQVDDENDKNIFKAWVKDFDNAGDSAYIEFAGKAFCDYDNEGIDPTLNSTIYHKKSVLDESYRRFIY